MEKLFMSAGVLTSIVLCLVGIVKTPFKKFKDKHPMWYRATFCVLSIILSVVLPILAQIFVMNGAFASMETLLLCMFTLGGVFFSYGAYEGVGIKKLFNNLFVKIKELCSTYSDSKLSKIVGKVGIEKLNEISVKLQQEAQKQKEEDTNKEEATEQIISSQG